MKYFNKSLLLLLILSLLACNEDPEMQKEEITIETGKYIKKAEDFESFGDFVKASGDLLKAANAYDKATEYYEKAGDNLKAINTRKKAEECRRKQVNP